MTPSGTVAESLFWAQKTPEIAFEHRSFDQKTRTPVVEANESGSSGRRLQEPRNGATETTDLASIRSEHYREQS
jgi:hypothetical protein